MTQNEIDVIKSALVSIKQMCMFHNVDFALVHEYIELQKLAESKPSLMFAEVWHEGTRSYYTAQLIEKLAAPTDMDKIS